MHPTPATHDVIIMGGGLAGLTLALQLKRRFGDIDVLVLERRSHPVPHATHKVGESSVEIGAHYFDTVLGLKQHLDEAQLRKFGFRFFFSEGRRDLDAVTEVGASRPLAIPSYQIDRGIFENHLAEVAAAQGVRFVDNALVRRMALDPSPQGLHRIEWTEAGEPHAAQCRWMVDACGRAGLLKRQLGLVQPNDHQAHAVWFRIGNRLMLDDWGQDPAWRARCTPAARWLSTNHLVGAGYWVWLIPLASGSHSVGIVADPAFHPLERMDSFDKAMDWLAEHQPVLFDVLDGQRDKLQDFAFMRKFSYGCKQVFSGERWALTGEAGLFLDPFYSPGSDFIAMSNTFICDLITHDRGGRSVQARAQLYDHIYHSFYDSTLALYQGQYGLFGDPEVLPVKVVWDYTYYWGVLSQLFFHERLTDVATLGNLREELQHCQQLNIAMQGFLRAWSSVSERRNPARMLDQAALPWFAELNASLRDALPDAIAFQARLRACVAQLRTLAHQIHAQALAQHPRLDDAALAALLAQPMPRTPIDRDAAPMLFEQLARVPATA
ncbi:flavin-dependent dehydrogenase [Pseudacidovorax intermedius]|uniref:Flavin-dependent dehydrogenase n=1 Tax=Pseudacidovorax intermedius TaxID=433924 RepID=A0A370FSZ0_9BURK|nr:NAD(P)/FAD-dependent oxidoreductase [Pseudacidovorax intermedius]RDI28868.1 flavin-dependent dehydrogenase [Pseudacidovorax intermedius]